MVFESYKRATRNELWDSPNEIEEYYQDEKNFQKLLSGEDGSNLIQTHQAKIMTKCMDEWTEYILNIAKELLKEKNKFDRELDEEFTSVSNYCRGLSHNILGKNRMYTNPTYQFNYDIQKWLKDSKESFLVKFRLPTITVEFRITDEQFKVVEDKIRIFGNSPIGMAQIIKRIPRKMLCRNPIELRKKSFVEL